MESCRRRGSLPPVELRHVAAHAAQRCGGAMSFGNRKIGATAWLLGQAFQPALLAPITLKRLRIPSRRCTIGGANSRWSSRAMSAPVTTDSFDPRKITRPDRALMMYYFIVSLPSILVALLPLFFKYETLRYRFDDEGVSMS